MQGHAAGTAGRARRRCLLSTAHCRVVLAIDNRTIKAACIVLPAMPAFAALAKQPCSLVTQRAPARASRPARLSVSSRLQDSQQPTQQQGGWASGALRLCGAAAAAAVLLAGGAADAREKVAEFPTSGLLFRDTVKIIELDDDKGGAAAGSAASAAASAA